MIGTNAPPSLGQDAYQQTHPVLFSDRAIYIVIYSLRTGASPADITRHLMNVTIHCKDAPVLLVGTHADVVHGGSGLSMAALKARFPQVRLFHSLSLLELWPDGNFHVVHFISALSCHCRL